MKVGKKDIRLPKRFKERWIKALRSGKYKQGTMMLYNKETDCYCPLGVAGVLCGIEPERMNCYATLESFEEENIPIALSTRIITLEKQYNLIVEKIIGFSDREKKSFNWIAGWISRNL